MPDQDDVDAVNDAIVENSARPNRTRFGNREVQQNSLRDQVEAAKHLAANVQAQSAGRLIFNKISPPGAA